MPGGFNAGDVVEMQLSFVAIPNKGNKIKLTSRLLALTLLDNQQSKVRYSVKIRSVLLTCINARRPHLPGG